MKRIIIVFVLGIIGIACSGPDPRDKDYADWVRDYKNGMHVRHVQNHLAFDVQYEPAEYLWMKTNGEFDIEKFTASQAKQSGVHYFMLSISSLDGNRDVIKELGEGDINVYNELLYYFSYRFQNDLTLEINGNQIPCSIFHYEQHGTKVFILGFENEYDYSDVAILTINSSKLGLDPVSIKILTASKFL